MRLTSKGIPKKIDKKVCKRAVKFFAEQLFSTRLYETIDIHLEFLEYEPHEFAYCNAEDDINRSFLISVNNNLSPEITLVSIAHEMIHVKQIAKGELKHYVHGDRVGFQGEIFEKEDVTYWQSPWEREARVMEKKLYKKFLISEKSK